MEEKVYPGSLARSSSLNRKVRLSFSVNKLASGLLRVWGVWLTKVSS